MAAKAEAKRKEEAAAARWMGKSVPPSSSSEPPSRPPAVTSGSGPPSKSSSKAPSPLQRTEMSRQQATVASASSSGQPSPQSSKAPSTAYCPPEMARRIELNVCTEYEAEEAYDLWSFGVVLAELCATAFSIRFSIPHAIVGSDSTSCSSEFLQTAG